MIQHISMYTYNVSFVSIISVEKLRLYLSKATVMAFPCVYEKFISFETVYWIKNSEQLIIIVIYLSILKTLNIAKI